VFDVRPEIWKGLTFDSVQRVLYYTDSVSVWKLDLNGAKSHIISDGGMKPQDIVVDEKHR